METPLGVAGARARQSVDSGEWQALCELEAELEAELRDEGTRSSERSGRKSAERDSPRVSSGTPTRARASTERAASSRLSPSASPSPGYRLRRQPHPSWAPSASNTPASASSPGADRSSRRSRWSDELGVVLDGFGRPMLPLDVSASVARAGRAPLRERDTGSQADEQPAVEPVAVEPVAAVEPVVDARAGAHRNRGGFADDALFRPRTSSRALAASVPHRKPIVTRRKSSHSTAKRTARPPFVVGAGDSARARGSNPSTSRPSKENRAVFFHDADERNASRGKAFIRHSSPAGINIATHDAGARLAASDASRDFSRREEASRSVEEGGEGNHDLFAAAVDATRSLFDAVERRVRDAVEREIETRHRRGGPEPAASPPPTFSAASPPSPTLEPASDARTAAREKKKSTRFRRRSSPRRRFLPTGKPPFAR